MARMSTDADSMFEPMRVAGLPLSGRFIFLSSGIPNSVDWVGDFEPMEIAHAVVACARAILSLGGRLLLATHPTIAPLLLYLANEFPRQPDEPVPVVIYQSRLFTDRLPRETHEMAATGLAELRWTPAAPGGDPAIRSTWLPSVQAMRSAMLSEQEIVAAVFIGGMSGITDEHTMVAEMHPNVPLYALAQPGGEAARLVDSSPVAVQDVLRSNLSYPSVFNAVFVDIVRRVGT